MRQPDGAPVERIGTPLERRCTRQSVCYRSAHSMRYTSGSSARDSLFAPTDLREPSPALAAFT
jgi:hypothetical protein